MKLFLIALIVCTSALASVAPAEMKEIRRSATEVMYLLGAQSQLNPAVTRVRIIDELGSRVKVQFTFTEYSYGSRTCTYDFDLNSNNVVSNSWLCD